MYGSGDGQIGQAFIATSSSIGTLKQQVVNSATAPIGFIINYTALQAFVDENTDI
jgi:hypothetical protein